jgi:hypothetical protein
MNVWLSFVASFLFLLLSKHQAFTWPETFFNFDFNLLFFQLSRVCCVSGFFLPLCSSQGVFYFQHIPTLAHVYRSHCRSDTHETSAW